MTTTLEFQLGKPQLRWSAGQPLLRWGTGLPQLRWSLGQPVTAAGVPMQTILASSTEYVFVPVSATGTNGPYNPTGDTVQFAFEPSNTAPGTFATGTWFSPIANTFYAACLVGPTGSVTLSPGIYTIWVKITDSPEVPVRTPGQIQVQ